METTFIYILIDPITGYIRYVGKANNPKERYKNHKNPCRDTNTHKRNWINSLRKQGEHPLIEVIDTVPISEWKYWEKFWISYFRFLGCDLVNHCLGGDGLTFGNQTSFKKDQVTWNDGTANIKVCEVCGKDFKRPKSANQRTCSRSCSLIIRKKSSTIFKAGQPSWIKGLKGIKLRPDKNVHQYDKTTGAFIKTWNTAKEPAALLKINEESIGQCCRSKAKTAGNFIWSYKKENCVTPVTSNNYPKNRKLKKKYEY